MTPGRDPVRAEGSKPAHVKICCIASFDEARLAIDAGAAALGLVSAMPSDPGVIVERAGVPVWLAGGLNAGNIAGALAPMRPHGVDLCKGVRNEGRLDVAKLCTFFGAVTTREGRPTA